MPVKVDKKKEEEPKFGEVTLQKGGKKEGWHGKGQEKMMKLSHNEEAFLLNIAEISQKTGVTFITSTQLSNQLKRSLKDLPMNVPNFGVPADSTVDDILHKMSDRGLVSFGTTGVEPLYALTKKGMEEVEKIKRMEFLLGEIKKHGEKRGHGGDESQD